LKLGVVARQTSWPRFINPSRITVGQRNDSAGVLTVRAHLRPVDVYAYLRARFGEPNGIQNFLRKDDSDNLIHWDFNLKSGNADIYISGASREIMFLLSERLSDQQWRSLIVGLKNDFARVATAKGTLQKVSRNS
jgi:hypothetical protein